MQLLLREDLFDRLFKDLEQIPVFEILLGELAFGALHVSTTTNWLNLYKLQLCYG